MWGKEGYLPKKESKTGDETEALPVPQDSIIVENVDQPITKKDQSQVITQSKEEKEKQLLASSLFVGLGSESTINLVSSQLYSTENLCPLWCTKKLALQKNFWLLPIHMVWMASPAPEPPVTYPLYSERESLIGSAWVRYSF